MIKIAFFTENWTYGGNSIFAEDLINSFNVKEYKLEFFLNTEAKINKKKFPKSLKLQRKLLMIYGTIMKTYLKVLII